MLRSLNVTHTHSLYGGCKICLFIMFVVEEVFHFLHMHVMHKKLYFPFSKMETHSHKSIIIAAFKVILPDYTHIWIANGVELNDWMSHFQQYLNALFEIIHKKIVKMCHFNYLTTTFSLSRVLLSCRTVLKEEKKLFQNPFKSESMSFHKLSMFKIRVHGETRCQLKEKTFFLDGLQYNQ